MSVNKVNNDGSLALISGGTLYADAPVGSIQAYGGNSAPWGWLLCQGQAISRTTYAELFNVIGTSFGEGDGSTTFNVPDLQGKTLVGYNSSETEFNAIGKTGGEKTHKLTVSEMPKHNHVSSTLPNASADVTGAARLAASGGTGINFSVNNQIITAGGDGAHNNLQPYNTVNYIIKATTIALPSDFEAAVDDKINKVINPTLTSLTNVTQNIANSQTYINQNIFTIPSNAKRVFFALAGSGNIGGFVELIKGIQGYARDFNNITEALVEWTNSNAVHISYIFNHSGAAKDVTFQCKYLA